MQHACEKISSLVSEGLERKLNFRERISMRFHFLMCGACKQYNDNMLKLHQVFKLRGKLKHQGMKLPHEKREKILAALQEIDF